MRVLFFLLVSTMAFGQDSFYFKAARQAESCTPPANELNTTAGVTSDLNCNESNSLTGWIANGNVSIDLESVDVDTGVYTLKVTSDDGGSGFAYIALGGNGDDVDFQLRIKQSVGSNGRFFVSPSTAVNSYFTTSSWFTHTGSTTGTGTMFWRIYPAGSGGAGNTNDVVLVEYLAVQKTN